MDTFIDRPGISCYPYKTSGFLISPRRMTDASGSVAGGIEHAILQFALSAVLH